MTTMMMVMTKMLIKTMPMMMMMMLMMMDDGGDSVDDYAYDCCYSCDRSFVGIVISVILIVSALAHHNVTICNTGSLACWYVLM